MSRQNSGRRLINSTCLPPSGRGCELQFVKKRSVAVDARSLHDRKCLVDATCARSYVVLSCLLHRLSPSSGLEVWAECFQVDGDILSAAGAGKRQTWGVCCGIWTHLCLMYMCLFHTRQAGRPSLLAQLQPRLTRDVNSV